MSVTTNRHVDHQVAWKTGCLRHTVQVHAAAHNRVPFTKSLSDPAGEETYLSAGTSSGPKVSRSVLVDKVLLLPDNPTKSTPPLQNLLSSSQD